MKPLALGLVLGVLAGCGVLTKEPETLAVPLQAARNVYATVRTLYQDGAARVRVKCEKKELTEAECLRLAGVQAQAQALDFQIRRGLENPKAELDLEKIARLLELASQFVP